MTLHGHAMDVASLAWSPNGARLASGGLDYSIRLWKEQVLIRQGLGDLAQGEPVDFGLFGHQVELAQVAQQH